MYTIDDSLIANKEEKKLIKLFHKLEKITDFTLISDYGHGMITNNLAKILVKKSKFTAVNAQVNASNTISHNLKKYKSIDFMIINENELRHEMRSKNENIEDLIKEFSLEQKIKNLMITRGSSGSIFYNLYRNKFNYIDAFAKSAVDKIGAGDVMLGMMSLMIYKKIDIDLAMLISSLCSAESVKFMANKFVIKKDVILKTLDHVLS